MTLPIGGIWTMKSGDSQPSNFASTEAGLILALAYGGTKGKTFVGPGDMTIASTITVPDGAVLFLGAGTYTVNSGSFSIGNGSTLRGDGYNSTKIKAGAAFSGTALVANTYALIGGTAPQSCYMYDFEVDGTKATATVTYGIYIKGVGQPSVARDIVVHDCSGDGFYLEGITTNAASGPMLDNCWANANNGHGVVVTGPFIGGTLNRISSETIPAGKAGIYIDGSSASTNKGGLALRDIHIEAGGTPFEATTVGILIEDSKNISVDGACFVGSGGLGDLVKITGTASDSYNITLKNLYVRFNAVLNTVNDVTNGVTLTNEVPFYATGPMRILGAITAASTLDLTGNLTAGGAANTFGTLDTSQVFRIGKGGSATAAADLYIDAGTSGATQARWNLQRNNSTDFLGIVNGTLEQLQFRNGLQFSNTSGTALARLTTDGKLRVGDGNTPNARLEPVAGTTTSAPIKLTTGTNLTSPVPGAVEFTTDDLYFTITTGTKRAKVVLDDGTNLTSGKYPKITTNGRLADGPTPLAGTKVYYVSDTSGGAVTRKLTFTDGILTAET